MAAFLLSITQLLAILSFILKAYAAFDPTNFERPEKLNVIFMVSDGLGPYGVTLARTFKQKRDGKSIQSLLHQDGYLVGLVRTGSNNTYITDSAAAGTAFASGFKTLNGAIGVDAEGKSIASVLEAMKLDGYLTGLVSTTRITDATPAAQAAHVKSRRGEDLIAQQELWENPLNFTNTVDLILGGGRCFFLPANTTGGCRSDSRNLVAEARARGYQYVGDRSGFDLLRKGANVSLPLLGLLASGNQPYEIDRNASVIPSLAEQTQVALTALSNATKKSDKGFFVLLEGARIDHAGHDNDAQTHAREVLAYDDAFKVVKDFVDAADVPTVVISVSDHETGGLTVGDTTGAFWLPQVLVNATGSGRALAEKIVAQHQSVSSKWDAAAFSKYLSLDVIEAKLGIRDYTERDVAQLRNITVTNSTSVQSDLMFYLNEMVSSRARVGFTTDYHSAGDVSMYAYSNDAYFENYIYSKGGVTGDHDNTDVARIMEAFGGVDLKDTTEKIRAAN